MECADTFDFATEYNPICLEAQVILVVSVESLNETDWRGTTIGMVRSIIEVCIFEFDLEEFSLLVFPERVPHCCICQST